MKTVMDGVESSGHPPQLTATTDPKAGNGVSSGTGDPRGGWSGPRTVTVPRASYGFGFTLRHFIVYPPESAVAAGSTEDDIDYELEVEEDEIQVDDVTAQGGTLRGAGDSDGGRRRRKRSRMSPLEPMDTIFVKQVKEESPAQHAGLQNGDRIVSVNGHSVAGKTYSQVIALIQASDQSVKLLVVPKDEDILQMAYRSSAHVPTGSVPYRGSADRIPSPPPPASPTPATASSSSSTAPQRFKSELQMRPENAAAATAAGGVETASGGTGTGAGGSGRTATSINLQPSTTTTTTVSMGRPTVGMYRPLPYCRANTAAMSSSSNLLVSSVAANSRPYSSTSHLPDATTQRRSCPVTESPLAVQSRFLSPPGTPVWEPNPNHRNYQHASHPANLHYVGAGSPSATSSSSRQSTAFPFSGKLMQQAGGTSTSSSSSPFEVSQSQSQAYSAARHHQAVSGGAPTQAPPQALPDKHMISLVAERMKKFESCDSIDSDGSGSSSAVPPSLSSSSAAAGEQQQQQSLLQQGLSSSSSLPPTGASRATPPVSARFGCDSVASRTALFERPSAQQSYSQARPPSCEKLGSPPATINIYFRKDSPANSTTVLDKSPERLLHMPGTPPSPRVAKTHKPALRQASYLSAVNASQQPQQQQQQQQQPQCGHARRFHQLQHDSSTGSSEQPQHRRTPLQPTNHVPSSSSSSSSLGFRTKMGTWSYQSMGQWRSSAAASRLHNHMGSSPGPLMVAGGERPGSRATTLSASASSSTPHLQYNNHLTPHRHHRHHHHHQSASSSAVASVFNDENRPPLPAAAAASQSFSATADPTTQAVMREHSSNTSAADRESKLQRRTSYLMATRQVSGTSSTSTMSTPPVTDQRPPPLQMPPPHTATATSSSMLDIPDQPTPGSASSSGSSPRMAPGDLSRTPSPSATIPPHPDAAAAATAATDTTTTPTKTSNIKKLKSFFGEKTPRILEAQSGALSDRRSMFDLPSPAASSSSIPSSHVVYEGTLNCKVAVTDGKRASDRSWKPMWGVLRGHALYLFKDKNNTSPSACEDGPISIKASIVDIAHDYTKKKHVFRLTTYNGSEYLCQAEDSDAMLRWIQCIQANNNPDQDVSNVHESGVASHELIVRKTLAYQEQNAPPPPPTTKSSPQVGKAGVTTVAVSSKSKPSRSMRAKSPAAAPSSHSPGPRHKHKGSQDSVDSPKSKDGGRAGGGGTWKGKMAKKFRRYGSTSSTEQSSSVPTPDPSSGGDPGTMSFCVPLDCCPPSDKNEFVPYVVDLLASIVETRGLENQGIYRVPGNTGAVNSLMQQLDRGQIDPGGDSDNERGGLNDLNVVSSLLKLFFRKLPEALITEELYEPIIAANRTENPEKRMLKVKRVLHDLPEHNFETFRYIAEHLHTVLEKGDINKMDARNLAIVFGPTLIRTTDDSMVTMVKDMSDQCRIIESIISHWQWFFGSWDEDVYVPVDEDNPDGCGPISGMNQQLLNKAENLELGERGRDNSAKDLVSNIFSVANKRIRKRDKSKSGSDSIEADMDSETYNERNIDQEIAIRKNRESSISSETTIRADSSSSSMLSTVHESVASSAGGMSVTNSFTHNSRSTMEVSESSMMSSSRVVVSSSSSSSQQHHQSMTQQSRKNSSGSTVSSTMGEDSWSRDKEPVEVTRYRAYPTTNTADKPYLQIENSKEVMRGERARSVERQRMVDHDELNHHPSATSIQYQVQCGRDAAESRALREREANARQEQERRARARQRIELELKRTQQELEAEDEDDIAVPPLPPPKAAASSTSLDYNPAVKEFPPAPPLPQPPYGQQRRGSLDSLLNPYESVHSPKEECNTSKADSSSSGGDFSQSLTTTFDRKWQMLHQLPAPRQPDRLPPFKPSHATSQSDSPRPFRDPSLHRNSPKPDEKADAAPQVGIAFRMERPAANLPRTTNVYASKPPELGLSLAKGTGGKDKDNEQASAQQYAAALRKSTEKLYGSRENLLSTDTVKQPTTPQPVKRRKNGADKKVKQRRHTVGGSSDLEHFKALMSVVHEKKSSSPNSFQGSRPSAWERLQPLTPDDDSRDVQSWLQRQQKLRQCRSTPSLLDPLLFYRHPPTFSPAAHARARRGQGDVVLSSSSASSSPSVQLQPASSAFTFESSI